MANFSIITPSDLDTSFDEPRVQDLRLGEALGFARPRKVREIIERNRVEIQRYGVCPVVGRPSGPRGGRPSNAHYLNEPQALLVCMFSDTPRAADVRHQVITVFMEWRRCQQQPVSVRAHNRRTSARVDDAIKLRVNIDRLESIVAARLDNDAIDVAFAMLKDIAARHEAHMESINTSMESLAGLLR